VDAAQAGPARTDAADRTRRVLRHDRASMNGGIADAIVMKAGEIFFLAARTGDVPLNDPDGFGLYYRDCRFLNGYELRLAGRRGEALGAEAARGDQATFHLANPELQTAQGLIAKEDLSVTWVRIADRNRPALRDILTIRNFSVKTATVTLSLRFSAAFEPVFVVRGMSPEHRGTLRDPQWHGGTLRLAYDGADGVIRTLSIACTPAPTRRQGAEAQFDLTLASQQHHRLEISLVPEESPTPERASAAAAASPASMPDRPPAQARSTMAPTSVTTDDPVLNRVLSRSLEDLRMLTTSLRGHRFFAAGVPWYVTLFGRDTLISALQVLAFDPGMAVGTLRLLATFQGTHDDAWREEAPGKIPHELRIGELAHLDEIPQTPYYGTVDATPLFLILLAQLVAWTGQLDLARELEAATAAALRWIDDSARATGGYLAYEGGSAKGLANQGWKDSGDAIVNADGSLARPPIALAEVQGYIYLAKTGLAALHERLGARETARRLRQEATDLQRRFNHDFWLADRAIYALALQRDGVPVAAVASNAGQVLWSGDRKSVV